MMNEPDINLETSLITEPKPQAQAAAMPESAPHSRPEPAMQEPPRRRVGSITLGASLIAAGVFFLLYYFWPEFNWMLVLKIAPAAGLILLGCEVLVFAVRPGRWKYDFVSVLVCLALMCGCFGMTLLPTLWAEIDPARQNSIDQMLDEYLALVYTSIQQAEPEIAIQDASGHLSLNRGVNAQTLQELAQCTESERYLRLNIYLFGPYETAGQFAQDCRQLTDVLRTIGISPNYLCFCCLSGSNAEYHLALSGSFQQNWTAEQMAGQTTVISLLDQENDL